MREVSKQYPARPRPVPVLENINLIVEPAQRVAVVGPSGSGKSTLLNLLGSLDAPTSGRVMFKGRDIANMSAEALAKLRNRDIGFIFQQHHLLPQLTVIENVLVPTLIAKAAAKLVKTAEQLLERVGLEDRIHHRPGQISGGERQRVAVVRALINKPSLLLADEPTGSLNQKGAEDLARLLLELNIEHKMALVVVTHSESVAEIIGNVYEMRDRTLHRRD